MPQLKGVRHSFFLAALLWIQTAAPASAAAPQLLTPAAALPNDSYVGQEWHLTSLGVPQAWDITQGSPALKVAVLDTGVDASQPDLAGRILQGWNTDNNTPDTTDTLGHGTWVAGTIAANANNGIGVAGIAPNVQILPYKITDSSGNGRPRTVVEGLQRAQAAGAKIANISFNVFGGDAEITAAARDFVAHGGIVFAAAGNDASTHQDADNPYIVSVGSVNSQSQVSHFSSSGPYVDMAAPGEQIATTGLGDGYVHVSGTSFASPIAAATAALVWSANPGLTNTQVVQILKDTARDIGPAGRDDMSGAGIIDAGNAVAAATNFQHVVAATPVAETTLVIPPVTTPGPTPAIPEPVVPTPVAVPVTAPVIDTPPAPAPAPTIQKTPTVTYVRVRALVRHYYVSGGKRHYYGKWQWITKKVIT